MAGYHSIFFNLFLNWQDMTHRNFKNKVLAFYKAHVRTFPWRKTKNPYRILVSEVMLQQTQVDRAIDKYRQFITAFPDFATLARASVLEILGVWQGLGYNRRALFLKQIAQIIIQKYDGILPQDPDVLKTLPGIGYSTACAIAAFAFNKPVIFMETNIRALFIYSFFNARAAVSDREILPLVEKTLDTSNPREWYYALMDYGAHIKKTRKNPSRKSAHYSKQSPFKGSNREIRGMILKELLKKVDTVRIDDLAARIGKDKSKIVKNVDDLVDEGFIKKVEQNVLNPP
jgi:A/G-specific adenine glycosylase